MSDVFAGGAAKIKDRTADSAPRPARRSFEPKNRPPTSTPGPVDEDEEESQVVNTKFKIRGCSGASFSSGNTASGAAAEEEGASSGPAKQPGASLFGPGSKTSTKQQRTTSPPPPTPTSSGEQMPPPPIASQLRLPSTHLDTPRRSTSRASSGSSITMYSDGEGGRGSEAGRGVAKGRERGGQASSKEQQQEKAATRGFKVRDNTLKDVRPIAQDRQLHGDQSNRKHAETGSKSSEEDEEETPLCITEDRPTPSPMTGGDEEQDDELVMSGGGGTGYGGDGDEDSEDFFVVRGGR
ncbi:hypothetical protein BCR35DRAFT_331835 [Leucosporidium creatinivorum]|uniref:Uncharacterized protein n=1 Tax=Leucosporidium creatinivorum TaxID=106004 RepID=A0A1Y2FBR9_9BASI|nr:hypothetical protein BCR35DRAFT_331835 [Leucosporidium creatinivorum]